ncbi:hypothetical protein DENSPDRAFT_530747 [Dentipellis sp. KUC8613]|nr:hypothetical protein DENSPDRAFT_530747 [Dentipellis sp. KUC8613]
MFVFMLSAISAIPISTICVADTLYSLTSTSIYTVSSLANSGSFLGSPLSHSLFPFPFLSPSPTSPHALPLHTTPSPYTVHCHDISISFWLPSRACLSACPCHLLPPAFRIIIDIGRPCFDPCNV